MINPNRKMKDTFLVADIVAEIFAFRKKKLPTKKFSLIHNQLITVSKFLSLTRMLKKVEDSETRIENT